LATLAKKIFGIIVCGLMLGAAFDDNQYAYVVNVSGHLGVGGFADLVFYAHAVSIGSAAAFASKRARGASP
jgi:hypothetical protein